MKDYTIAEHYTIPSKGKIYDKEVNPDITIRSMTTAEEMLRLAPSDLPYKNMCSVLDECIVDGLGISTYDLCVGDYQFLLHKLRVVTYGSDYPLTSTCPYCGCQNRDHINLDDLPVIEFDEKVNQHREFDLPKTGKHIRLKIQTPRILDKITERVKDFKRKTEGQQLDPTLIYTIAALIETIDGEKPDPVKIDDWVRKLPMADTTAIINHADAFNRGIGIDINLINTCDVCGLNYQTTFHATSEFFRPALDGGREAL